MATPTIDIPLMVEDFPTARDPASMQKVFWGALAKGRPEVAMESARRILVRPIVEESLSLLEEGVEGSTSRGGDVHGTCTGKVLSGTPTGVILTWTAEGTTTLIKLPNIVCGAQLDKNPTTIFDETNF